MSTATETTDKPRPTIGVVPMDNIVVVDRKHPLAKEFWTPRNGYKPDAAMVNSIRANGGPDYAPKVWPWKDADGKQWLIVIDGNQRVIASREAGLDKLKVDVQVGMSQQDASRLATRTNSQRKDNSFATNAILALRMLNLDEKGKPQGLTYEQAAAEFGKTHTWVRQIVAAYTGLPNKIKNDIENGKVNLTLIVNAGLTKAEYLGKDNEEKALAKYAELLADGGPVENTSGKAGRAPRMTSQQAKNPDHLTKNEWQLIALNPNTPEDASTLIRAFIGEISFQQARNEGLDWLVKPAKEASAKAKGKGKGKKAKAEKSETPTASNEPVTDVDMDLFE